jgi:ribonucleoside-diphosphate reductase beta chain
MIEPILISNDNRFVLFPIEHNDIWDYYLEQNRQCGPQKKLDLSKDIDGIISNDNERHFIKTY